MDQAPPRGRRERLGPRAVRGLHARSCRATACDGARLKPATLAVTVNDKNISEVCDLSIGESAKFLAALELTERDRMIAERVTKEINARLGFLLDVGLDYLTLSRVGRHARRRRGAAHPAAPARSAPAWSARCTCSTSRRSGCTSATTAA